MFTTLYNFTIYFIFLVYCVFVLHKRQGFREDLQFGDGSLQSKLGRCTRSFARFLSILGRKNFKVEWYTREFGRWHPSQGEGNLAESLIYILV